MKRLKVIIAPSVKDQITRQVLRIAQDSVNNALAWESRLAKTIQEIGDVHGDAIDEDASRRLGYSVRKAVFEQTYLVHYWIDESAGIVRIINFRHGARLPRSGEP